MTQSELLESLATISRWRKGDEVAPHKPLMLLFALCRIVKRKKQMMSFTEVQKPLAGLLKRYGPVRDHYHPEYPFWRLQTSGIWKIENGEGVKPRKSNTDPPPSELVRHGVKAGFSDGVFLLLHNDDSLIADSISLLLEKYFPIPDRSKVLVETIKMS